MAIVVRSDGDLRGTRIYIRILSKYASDKHKQKYTRYAYLGAYAYFPTQHFNT